MELSKSEINLLSNLIENIDRKLEKNEDGEWHPSEEIYFTLSDKMKEVFDELRNKIYRQR